MARPIQPCAVPVLRDLLASCPMAEGVWDGASWQLEDADGRWGLALESLDGSRTERWFDEAPSLAEQVALVANQVQDWAVETLNGEGRSPVWPVCPAHPSTHPLDPITDEDVAIWVCPRDRTIEATVGALR